MMFDCEVPRYPRHTFLSLIWRWLGLSRYKPFSSMLLFRIIFFCMLYTSQLKSKQRDIPSGQHYYLLSLHNPDTKYKVNLISSPPYIWLSFQYIGRKFPFFWNFGLKVTFSEMFFFQHTLTSSNFIEWDNHLDGGMT